MWLEGNWDKRRKTVKSCHQNKKSFVDIAEIASEAVNTFVKDL